MRLTARTGGAYCHWSPVPKGAQMSEERNIEDEIRRAIKTAVEHSNCLKEHEKWFARDPLGFIQTEVPILVPYLIACSVERQEKLMQAVRDDSKTMRRLTWAVVLLTGCVVVVAFLTLARIR
jgi:hypothetical protein